ncbi:hypothetical protein ACSBOB_20350 [Mesorhizobium sp. ASY16-5R]|uniref:hypothetical protein n=1 Tax=Mesorhizobium sp. ASY16-5R TaxID=3445772 RepID=UPI003FA131CF
MNQHVNRRAIVAAGSSVAMVPALATLIAIHGESAAAAEARPAAPSVTPELLRRIARFIDERRRLDVVQERHNVAEAAYLTAPENARPDPLPPEDDEWREAFRNLRICDVGSPAFEKLDHPALIRRRKLEDEHKVAMAAWEQGCLKRKEEVAFEKIDAAYQRQISRVDATCVHVMRFRPRSLADLKAKLRTYDLWNGETETAFYHLWKDAERITREAGKVTNETSAPAVEPPASRIQSLFEEWDAIYRLGFEEPYCRSDEEADAHCDRRRALEEQMEAIPSKSAADLAAKIIAITGYGSFEFDRGSNTETWRELESLVGRTEPVLMTAT